jgi:hypothetical protein
VRDRRYECKKRPAAAIKPNHFCSKEIRL